MKISKRKEQVRKQKAAKGFKVQTNVRAGTGFNSRDSYGSPYGVY